MVVEVVNQRVAPARRREHAGLSGARTGLSSVASRVNQVRADTRWSDEGRKEQEALALGEGGAAVRGAIGDAQV